MTQQPQSTLRPRRLILGVAMAALSFAALALAIPVLRLAAQEKKASSPLHLVPDDAVELVHVRVPELMQSQLFRMLPDRGRQELLRELSFLLPVEMVDTITVASTHSSIFSPGGPFGGPMVRNSPPDYPAKEVWRKEVVKDMMPIRDKLHFDKEKVVDKPFIVRDKDKPNTEKPKNFRDAVKPFQLKEKVTDKVHGFQDKERAKEKEKVMHAKDFAPAPNDFPPQFIAAEDIPTRFAILTLRADLDPVRLEAFFRGRATTKVKGKHILYDGYRSVLLLDRRTLVVTSGLNGPAALARLLERPIPAAFKGPLAPALGIAATGRHTVTAAQAVPKAMLTKAMAALNAPYQGFQRSLFRTLALPVATAQPGVLTLDLSPEASATLELHLADAAAAKQAADAVRDGLVLLRTFVLDFLTEGGQDRGTFEPAAVEAAALQKLLIAELEDALRAAQVDVKDATVRATVRLPIDTAALQQRARAAAAAMLKDPQFLAGRRRVVSQNNLKEIGLALHNFHDTYKHFPPPAICDPNGKPLLSWRVAILPYIEQDALYRQFRMDQAWDSPHNLALIEKMPKTYATPGVKAKEPFTTSYQAFVGPGAGFELLPARGRPFGAQGLRLPAAFTDGTSNTLLVAEAAQPVPWTKPADLRYDPNGPLPKLGGPFAPGFNVVFADASVHFFPGPPEDAILRALITRNGGEPVPYIER